MNSSQPLHALEQMLMAHLDQGARDEYEDRWEGAEDYIRLCSPEQLRDLRSEVAQFLFAMRSEERFRYFKLDGNFRTPDEFDDWLRTLDRRMEQALAGDHSEPLVDPEG